MKKLLEDSYPIFEIDVRDRRGNIETLKACAIPIDDADKMNELGHRFTEELTPNERAEVAKELMSVIYGNEPGYYGKYSLQLMGNAITEFMTSINKKGEEQASPPGEESATASEKVSLN